MRYIRQRDIRVVKICAVVCSMLIASEASGHGLSPESESVCAIVHDPTRYDGHNVSVYGDFESDGIERVILSDRSCGKALTLQWEANPKGYDALRDALQGGMPGTLDKVIKARFTGVFRWQPDKTYGFVLSVEEISEVSRDLHARTPLQEFQDEQAEATKHMVNVCSLIKNPPIYDEQTVLLEVTYRPSAHKQYLTDMDCPEIQLNLHDDHGHAILKSARPQLTSLAKRDNKQSIEVVFRGIFHLIPDLKCVTPVCARFELDVRELISPSETTVDSNGKTDGRTP